MGGLSAQSLIEQGTVLMHRNRRADTLRLDKGRRVLAGMLHVGKMKYVMVVDDDDFVNRKLTSFVPKISLRMAGTLKTAMYGRIIATSYYLYSDFLHLCGTSLIIRADLYQLPETLEAASDEYIRRMLGSHMFMRDHLQQRGTPLAPLPFAGPFIELAMPIRIVKPKVDFILYAFHDKWYIRHPLVFFRRIVFCGYAGLQKISETNFLVLMARGEKMLRKKAVVLITDSGFLVPSLMVCKQLAVQSIHEVANIIVYLVDIDDCTRLKLEAAFKPLSGVRFEPFTSNSFIPGDTTFLHKSHLPVTCPCAASIT